MSKHEVIMFYLLNMLGGTIMKVLSVLHFPASPDWNSLSGPERAAFQR